MIGSSRKEKLKIFQENIEYVFKDPGLLNRALTHRSFVNEQRGMGLADNERLEFLGDAVLELVISHYMIDEFPQYSEGNLSKLRSYIVSEPVLAKIGHQLEIGQYLLLGKGEERTHGRRKNSLLANALEAVTAAIYLDGGLDEVRKFIISIFHGPVHAAAQSEHLQNYKSLLQEYTQAHLNSIPHYELLSKRGPHHRRVFEVQLRIGPNIYGTGRGNSKKEAEQQAAKQVLRTMLQKNKIKE